MTTYSTQTGGPGTTAATWSPAGVPGAGDTEQILAGTVAYTTSVSYSFQNMAFVLGGAGTAGLSFTGYPTAPAITLGAGTTLSSTAASAIATVGFSNNLTNAGVITESAVGGTLSLTGGSQATGVHPYAYPGNLINTGSIAVTAGTMLISTTRFGYQVYAPGGLVGVVENDGAMRVDGGAMVVNAPITTAAGGAGTITVAGGLMELGSGVDARQTIGVAAGAVLQVDLPSSMAAPITVTQGATIDLRTIGNATGVTYSAPDTLTIAGSAGTVQLHLPGYGTAGLAVRATADGAGGTQLAFVASTAATVAGPVFAAPVAGVVDATTVAASTLATLIAQGEVLQFATGATVIRLLDGVVSLAPGSTQAYIQRLYEGLLGRAAEQQGLASFDRLLARGTSADEVARLALYSPEHDLLSGSVSTQTDAQFVTGLYRSFLARAPDAQGAANWTAALAGGMSRQSVVAGFAQSPEAQAVWAGATSRIFEQDPAKAFVDQVYRTAFGRQPDPSGLASYSALVGPDLIGRGLAVDSIVFSPEFYALHGGQDASQLVTSFYQSALGRAPGPAELANWTAVANAAGSTRVLFGIAGSLEASRNISQLF